MLGAILCVRNKSFHGNTMGMTSVRLIGSYSNANICNAMQYLFPHVVVDDDVYGIAFVDAYVSQLKMVLDVIDALACR